MVRAPVGLVSSNPGMLVNAAELQSLLLRIQGQPNSARENLINSFSCKTGKPVIACCSYLTVSDSCL